MREKVKKLLIVWLACAVCISVANGDQSEEKQLKSAQLMQPYHRVEQASGCEFYIEEFCWPKLVFKEPNERTPGLIGLATFVFGRS